MVPDISSDIKDNRIESVITEQGGDIMIMVSPYVPYPSVRYIPQGQAVAAVGIAAKSSPDNEFEKRLYSDKKKKEVKRNQPKKRMPDKDTYEHASPEQEDLYAMERAERLLW